MTNFQHLDLAHKRYLGCSVVTSLIAVNALASALKVTPSQAMAFVIKQSEEYVDEKGVDLLEEFMKELDEQVSQQP